MTICSGCGSKLDTSADEQFHKMFDRCHRCCVEWSRVLIDSSDDRKVKDLAVEGERKIGFEVESNPTFASAVNIFSASLAHFKHDGSLRGASPIEFVSPLLSFSTYEDYCDKFFGMLDVTEWYSRQSAHVHIDTSDLSWMEFNLMAAKATSNWRLFAAMCPPSRFPIAGDRNDGGPRLNHIMPLFKSKAEMLYYIYGRTDLRAKKHSNMSIMRSSKRCNDGDMRGAYPGSKIFRYDWLNLHGHFHKGATEWRIFASTKSSEKMKNWITFLVQFTEAVKYMRYSDYIKAPISSMVSSDIWYWVVNRINTMKPLHKKFGKMNDRHYTGKVENPVIVEAMPGFATIKLPYIVKENTDLIMQLASEAHHEAWIQFYTRAIADITYNFDGQAPQPQAEEGDGFVDPFDGPAEVAPQAQDARPITVRTNNNAIPDFVVDLGHVGFANEALRQAQARRIRGAMEEAAERIRLNTTA